MTKSRHKIAARRYWTPAEEQMLRERYAETPTEDLAQELGRDVRGVYTKAQQMGIRKSAAYLNGPNAGRLRHADTKGLPTRFKPGQAPWNKGTHYVAGGRSSETRFKPGERGAKYQPIGSTRTVDGYLQRKVTDTGYPPRDWRPVHVLLWEQHYGPVKKGFAVCFLNGDRRDIRIENLELVARQDLMRRNTIHRLPPELVSVIQLHNGLKRRISRRSRA